MHVCRVEAETISGLALGAIHGEIGILQQILRIAAVGGMQRDADAAGRMDGRRLEIDFLGDNGKNPPGKVCRILAAGDIRLKDRELVAAEARQRILVADGLAQAGGDLLEEPVPG